MSEEASYEIGDPVRIKANGRDGTVDATFTDRNGTQYRVEYADASGSLCSDYRWADQLEAR